MMYGTAIAASERKYVKPVTWTHVLSTVSEQPNWCFDRFRLYTADSQTVVQARRADGTLIDEQVFSDPNYGWGGDFEASFMFDFSYNTAKEEIKIYIANIPEGATFQQLYARDGHAGTAVRYSEDPNAAGMATHDAELTYVNMGFFKFDYADHNVVFVYLGWQNLHTIDGADQFHGRTLDVRNNSLPATTLDDILIGCDTIGHSGGYLYLSGNNGRTTASDAAHASLLSKSWTIDIS